MLDNWYTLTQSQIEYIKTNPSLELVLLQQLTNNGLSLDKVLRNKKNLIYSNFSIVSINKSIALD